MVGWIVFLILIAVPMLAPGTGSLDAKARKKKITGDPAPLSEVEGLVWYGTDSLITFEKLAAFCAPILWFSPDEPLLYGKTGADIRIPEPFPFEESPDAPVVYYRVKALLAAENVEGPAVVIDSTDIGKSIIYMNKVAGIDLDFFFYYSSEEGFGGHKHDVEAVELKILTPRPQYIIEGVYAISIQKVIAKAHGVLWYDNTLNVDLDSKFPLTLLVEEGKHASCTDKNGDGYYTPGYDVNMRTNDAWGVRDIISSGALMSGSFESWMVKVRKDNDRVFPPLPPESHLWDQLVENGEYAPGYAKYELRPFPNAERAEPDLVHFIESKGDPDWPELTELNELRKFVNWMEEESFVKSISLALRFDGDIGISFVFPLLIVKNIEEPMSGGWLVNRIYFTGKNLEDFGYNILYTTSASRWVDGYIAFGFQNFTYETQGTKDSDTEFVLESGIKFRANLAHSPMKFLTYLGTDFWGLRIGIQNVGAWKIENMGYVVELGAGVW